MAHGIETSDRIGWVGDRKSIWHGIGEPIPDGLSAEEAFKLVGLDWETELVRPAYMHGDAMKSADDVRLHIRKDNGYCFGAVSKGYRAFDNMELANLADSMVGADRAVRTDTCLSLHGGKRVVACVRLPHDVVARDPIDVSKTYLVLSNGHGGSASLNVYLTSVRVVCANTLRASEADLSSGARFRHSGDFASKVEAAREALGLAYENTVKFQSQVSAMAGKSLSGSGALDFMGDALTDIMGPAYRDTRAKDEIRKSAFRQMMENYSEDIACGTVWGALNAVTEFNDFQRGRAKEGSMSRVYSNLYGVSNVAKGKALQRAMQLLV